MQCRFLLGDDDEDEKLESSLVWIRLLGFLQNLWLKDIFRVIGNKSGSFLKVDMSY